MPTSSQQQIRSIRRTVCIGLGGTGRDVMMLIRRLIVDRYGKLSELPIVSFVHLDTDREAGENTGLRTGNIYRGENLIFAPSEKLSATMKSQEIDDLINGLKQRQNYDRESPYDHIGEWFSPHLLQNVKAIENGASGIRPIGRLAFFHNYRKIRDLLQSAEARTRGHERKLLEKRLVLEPGLNIFVVGSLCGGTGSGIFLDVAYCLRNLYKTIEYQLKGYLVISPELFGDTPSMRANTYAALKELNYYATGNTPFQANYDPQYSVKVQENRPPFDFTYLISNQTETDYKILDKGKLFNVIAHKIFLDSSDELTNRIKSNEDNFRKQFANSPTDEHPRRNNQQTYLTFGLAKIFFPQELTVQIALNRVKIKLISYMLSGEGQTPDSNALLENFLQGWKTGQENINPFVAKLESSSVDKNRTISQELKRWKSDYEERITSTKSQAERQNLIEQLQADLKSQFRKAQPGETESTRGAWLTLIQQASTPLLKTLKNDLLQYLALLLLPSGVSFSIICARIFLDAITTELNRYQRDLEEDIQALGHSYDSDQVDKSLRNSLQIYDDLGKNTSFSFFRKRNTNVSFQAEMQNTLQEISKYIEHNIKVVNLQESLKIVQELLSFILELVSQAADLNHLLSTLKNDYERHGDDLSQLDQDDITGEAIFSETDIESYFQVFLPEAERRTRLNKLATRVTEITQSLTSEKSLLNLLVQDRHLDQALLQETIDKVVEEELGSLSISAKQSVIQRFLERYPLSDAENRMKQILREAEPLLNLNRSAPYFQNDPGNVSEIIAFQQIDTREVHKFENILMQSIGISGSDVIQSIQSNTEIVMIKEYAAFPLRLITGLEVLREQYNRQEQLDSTILHSDYQHTFVDPIPPSANLIIDLQDVFYTCIAFGILKETENSYIYDFFDEYLNREQTLQLSLIWFEALEQLANAPEKVRADLKYARDQLLNSIRNNKSLWPHTYRPMLQKMIKEISEFPNDHPNFPEVGTVLGVQATLNKHGSTGILQRLWNSLRAEFEQDNPTTRSIPHKSTVLLTSAHQRPEDNQRNQDSEVMDDVWDNDQSIEVSVIETNQPKINHQVNEPERLQENGGLEKLEWLVKVWREGGLTDEEFRLAKRKLLE